MAEEFKFCWYAIDDILAPKPEENDTCIICMDCPHETDWHLQIAHWYLEGAQLNLVDCTGKEHVFVIKISGFYIVEETGTKPKVYLAHGVKYWTIIPKPRTRPDDVLTIE